MSNHKISIVLTGLVIAALASPAAAAPSPQEEAEALQEALSVLSATEDRADRGFACAVRLQSIYDELGDKHVRAPELLYNAAVCYEIAGEYASAAQARTTIVERHAKSPLAQKAQHALAYQHVAIARYEEAAAAMEVYARRWPEAKETPDVVQDAAFLRAGLGQTDAAAALLTRAETLLQARDPRRAAALAWAKVNLVEETSAKNDQTRRDRAAEYLKTYGTAGGLGRRILAEVVLADFDWRRSCKQAGALLDLCVSVKPYEPPKGQSTCAPPQTERWIAHKRDARLADAAHKRFTEVVRLGDAWLREQEKEDEALRWEVRLALDLAALALADRELAPYLDLRMPTGLTFYVEDWRQYSDKPAVVKVYQQQLKKKNESTKRFTEFYERKTAAAKELARRYESIASQKNSARGMLAAAARRGLITQSYVDEMVIAEVPRDLTVGQATKAFCAAIQDNAAPIQDQARDAFAYCLERAEAFAYSDGAVGFCEGELARRYPKKYPPLGEQFARSQTLPSEPESEPLRLELPED